MAETLLLPRYYTVKAILNSMVEGEHRMRKLYLDNIQRAKDKVPAKDLLIWNVRDGWEPLCSFLGKPIPKGSIPHENKTGTNWMLDYAWKSPFVKAMEKTAIKKLGVRFGLLVAFLSLVLLVARTY